MTAKSKAPAKNTGKLKPPTAKSGAGKAKLPESNAGAVQLPSESFQHLKLSDIQPDPNQPRKHFDPVKLAELTASIAERGVDTPILVCPLVGKSGRYRLVCGERRWRASKEAGKKTIPALIRHFTEAQILETQLVENTQRDDMEPMEEAQAFDTLRAKHGYSVDELVIKSGKSEKLVRQRLRLIHLPLAAQQALDEGRMRLGVANAIMWIDNEYDRAAATHCILTETWRELALDVHKAQEYIRREFLLQLSKAPFNTKDAKLLPTAGSCLTCPKRSGATAALFEDENLKDSCLDRACFQKKMELHRGQQVEKQAAKYPVLNEDTTAKLFQYGENSVSSASGYVDLTEKVYQDKQNRTWQQLVGADAPIQVAVNQSGKAFHVLPRTEAVKLAKAVSQLDLSNSTRPDSTDALARKRAKARAAALVEYMVALTAYIEAISRDRFNDETRPLFALLAKIAVNNAPNEVCRTLAKRRELPPLKGNFGGQDFSGALNACIDTLSTVPALLALIVELIVLEDFQFWSSTSSSGKVEGFKQELSNYIGFDLAESIKEFTRQYTQKAPAKVSKTKVAPAATA